MNITIAIVVVRVHVRSDRFKKPIIALRCKDDITLVRMFNWITIIILENFHVLNVGVEKTNILKIDDSHMKRMVD